MVAIERVSARVPVIIGVAVAMVVAVAGLGVPRMSAAQVAGSRIIAIPASTSEPAVLAALKAAGMDRVWSSANTVIPLSDFSRIVEVPFAEAELRAGPGDPRRTPLFDELERRLVAVGPDGATWRLLYMQSAGAPDDVAITDALSGLGTIWASSAPEGTGIQSHWLWVPVCGWGLWLLVRRPRGDRLYRALLVCSWLPMLARSSPEAAMLAIVMQPATLLVVRARAARTVKPIRAVLILYASTAIAMLALDPPSICYLLVSAAFTGLVPYVYPRMDRLLHRRRMHRAPVFVPLTITGLRGQARHLTMGLAVPMLAVGIFTAVVPAGSGAMMGSAGLRLERSQHLGHLDGRDLVEKHIAYQRALTWGRIGDAVWGQKAFTEAYQYVEKSGTMHRSNGGGQANPVRTGPDPEQGIAVPKQALAILAEGWAFTVTSARPVPPVGE